MSSILHFLEIKMIIFLISRAFLVYSDYKLFGTLPSFWLPSNMSYFLAEIFPYVSSEIDSGFSSHFCFNSIQFTYFH